MQGPLYPLPYNFEVHGRVQQRPSYINESDAFTLENDCAIHGWLQAMEMSTQRQPEQGIKMKESGHIGGILSALRTKGSGDMGYSVVCAGAVV